MNHDPTSKMSRLSEFWISKASAKQRTGRAGRTGPGECFRLYSENEFNHFNDFAIPEIQRAPLEPLLLQIKSMDLGNPRQFDYIEVSINWPIGYIKMVVLKSLNLDALYGFYKRIY